MRTNCMSVWFSIVVALPLALGCGSTEPDGGTDVDASTTASATTDTDADSTDSTTSTMGGGTDGETDTTHTDDSVTGDDPTEDDDVPVKTDGIWVSADELQSQPTSGSVWNDLVEHADGGSIWGSRDLTPTLYINNGYHNVYTYANALVWARTGDDTYRNRARDEIAEIIANWNTDLGDTRALPVGRNLGLYPISAELIDLASFDARLDGEFRLWLADRLEQTYSDGRSLQSTHEDRPNNWGTMAGWSRVCGAIYLGDQDMLDSAALTHRGYLGEPEYFQNANYGDLGWQGDPDNPRGINALGAVRDGQDFDGLLADDHRRSVTYDGTNYPGEETHYTYEALESAAMTTIVLERAGYPAKSWSDEAIKRGVLKYKHLGENYPELGWHTWEPSNRANSPPLYNYMFGADGGWEMLNVTTASPMRHIAFTRWTHDGRLTC
jgi:hypothetical protein